MLHIGVKKVLVFVWAVTFSQAAIAGCNFSTHAYRDELANPAQIEHIAVEIKKSRKWFKNSISILASSSPIIEDQFKGRQSATLYIKYPFGSCAYPARVRQNGDWKDHIKLLPGGNVVSSLDVRLKEGNILNAVRFKLLLPETRVGINEVLGALMLQELGYLSPETFLVSAEVNGVQHQMLFQENAEKELLERRGRREGPIFEGDESLLWDVDGFGEFELQDVSLARQSNSKWAEKGDTSTQISLAAYLKLQAAYTDFAGNVEKAEKEDYFYGLDLMPNTGIDEHLFEDYALILLAMHGNHALRPHNRKFYFNSFTQTFEPIYYDGNIRFLKSDYVGSRSGDQARFAKTLERFMAFASPEVILQTSEKISALKDDASFYKAFVDRAGADKSVAQALFDDVLSTVSQRLLAYHEAMVKRTLDSAQKSSKDPAALQKQLIERVQKHDLDIQFIHVIGKTQAGSYLARPAFDDSSHQVFELSAADLISVMSNNTLDGKRVSLLPEPTTPEENSPQVLPFLSGEIVLSNGSQADINEDDRVITVSQRAPNDWVLIRGVKLENWTVAFEGAQQDPTLVEDQRFNEFGLTGCLNFYNVSFEDVTISGQNGQCEDTVNIVSSSGTLSAMTVENGFADAIDIDFAQISIDRLSVIDTGNDCFDVSTGMFEINHAVLVDCGDKGISVGENSLLNAASVDVQNSVIGVSSKDFSRVYIDRLSGDRVDVCAEAFQKKQEFGGALLQVNSFHCEGDVKLDPASNIVLNEVTQ